MKMMKRVVAAGGLALGGLALTAGPAAAAVDAKIDSVDRAGCELTVNVTVEDAATYYLAVFDDGEILSDEAIEAAEGESIQFGFTITSNISDVEALGLGLYVADAPDGPEDYLDRIDPYDFDGSDNVVAACAASNGEDSGETVTPVPAPSDTTLPEPSSADESPSNAEAPSSVEDAPSSPEDAPSSPEDAPAPILQPKFTG